MTEKSSHSTPAINLANLTEIGTAIAATPANIEDLVEVAYVEAVRFFEMDFFQIGLFEADRYRTIFWIKDGKRAPNEEFLLSESSGIINWMRRSNQSLLVDDFKEQADSLPATPSYIGEDPPTSGIFAPLVVGEDAIGILSAQSRQSNTYSSDQLQVLTFLAHNLAGPIALSLLHSEIDFLRHQVQNSEEISRVLAAPIALESRIGEVISMIHQGSDYIGVRYYEHSGDELFPIAQAPEDISDIQIDDNLLWRVHQTRRSESRQVSLVASAMQRNDPEGPVQLSELAVPVTAEDRLFGVLQIIQSSETNFTSVQRSQAEAIAANIALAILESRVTAKQQEENWFTTVLLEVARHASQPGDMDTALQAVLQLTTILTGTEWALLFIRERTEPLMRMGPSAGIRRQTELMLSEVRISLDSMGISDSWSDGMPIGIHLPDPLSSLLGTESATAVPLGTVGDLSGVFIMEGKAIPDRQISLIRGIANQISLRLENYKLIEEVAARRSLERELDTARTIQQSFLPREIPTLDGWQVGVNWSFARQVGGDFYDFIPLAEGPNGVRWGIVIADVTDKGIPAALFMALCRTLLRSVAINRIDPGSTLTRLNELIFADTQAELLVSIIYAVWEPEIAKLSFANAGHNPPLLFKPYHPAKVLTDHGIVIGATLDASYRTQTMAIQPGELMVFYTDGVTEAMDASGDMFGVHRLENLVLGLRTWSGQGVVDKIANRVADFCGTYELPDDLTTVVLYHPDGG